MPVIHVNMFEGRTVDQKRKMVVAMTDAVVKSLDVKPEVVHIIIHDLPKHNVAARRGVGFGKEIIRKRLKRSTPGRLTQRETRPATAGEKSPLALLP